MVARGFIERTRRGLPWPLVLRGLLAFLVAPLLPAVVLMMGVGALKVALGVRVEETWLLVSGVIALWSIPATWICLPLFLWIYERRGVRSLSAYASTGFAVSLICSLFFPPAMVIAVPAGSLIAVAVWCALWLGRHRQETGTGHRWQLKSRMNAE